MGLAHLKTGDVGQAVEELMAAVRDFPEDAELKRALDSALEGVGGAVAREGGAEPAPQPSLIEAPLSADDVPQSATPSPRSEDRPPQVVDPPRLQLEDLPRPPQVVDPSRLQLEDLPRPRGADPRPPRGADRSPVPAATLSRAGKAAPGLGPARPRRVSGPQLPAGRPTSRLTLLIAALLVTGAMALTLRRPSSSTAEQPNVSADASVGNGEASTAAASGPSAKEALEGSAHPRGSARTDSPGDPGAGSPGADGTGGVERSADQPPRSDVSPATAPADEAPSEGDPMDEPAVALVPSRQIGAPRSASGPRAEGRLPAPAAAQPVVTAPIPAATRVIETPPATDAEGAGPSAPDAPPAAAFGPATTPSSEIEGNPAPAVGAPPPASTARGFSPEARAAGAGGARTAVPDLARPARDIEMRPADPALNALRGRPRLARMDSQPALRQPLRIRYTDELARQGARGRAVFWVLVSAAGEVADVRVLQSSGSGALDAAAADAIRGTPYAPARRDGKPLPAWTQQQIVGLCCRSAAPR